MKQDSRSEKIKTIYSAALNEIERRKDEYVVRPGVDFTRNRKLSFKETISVIVAMGGQSIKKELFAMYPDIDKRMSTSAFVQARGKIKPEAIRDVFEKFNSFSKKYDDKTYMGSHLYAVDGSDINIAYNENSDTFCPNGGNKGFNQFHLNSLYDVCNKTFLDVEIQPMMKENEVKAAQTMVKRNNFPESSILIADRGYIGFNFLETINRTPNLDYLIRVKSNFCKEVSELPLTECDVDRIKELRTTQTNEDKRAFAEGKAQYISGPSKYNKAKKGSAWEYGSPYRMKLRIVRFPLPTGEYETIVTSLDREQFPLPKIKELYRMRWGIEISFRELKYAMGLVNLHAKREDFVIQEIYARLVGYNFAMRVSMGIQLTAPTENTLEYRINFTYAMHICRLYLWGSNRGPIEQDISACIEAYRPGRADTRKVKTKSFIPFVYRVA